jgi:hypothetical protein
MADNQPNQENSTFYDQADGKFEKAVRKASGQDKIAPGVTSDDDQNAGETYSKNLMNPAEREVRENEDASLQDDTYSFDEDNTENEEYHDVDDDIDFDNDEDFIQ